MTAQQPMPQHDTSHTQGPAASPGMAAPTSNTPRARTTTHYNHVVQWRRHPQLNDATTPMAQYTLERVAFISAEVLALHGSVIVHVFYASRLRPV